MRARTIASLLGLTAAALACGRTTQNARGDACRDCGHDGGSAGNDASTAGSGVAAGAATPMAGGSSSGSGATSAGAHVGEPGAGGGSAAAGETGEGGEPSAPLPAAVIVNVTLGADGASAAPDVSGDGRFVIFRTEAGNLAGDAPQGGVLVADVAQARLWRVGERDDVDQNPLMPERVRISGDGRFVFFRSNRRLSEDDGDDVEDVYRARRNGKQRRLASVADAAEGTYGFSEFDVSDDGRLIVFQEMPTLQNSTSARRSFLADLASNQLGTPIAPGTPDEYGYSIWRPTISGDGLRIGFDTRAPSIVQTPGEAHVYAQDVGLGWLRLASGSAGSVGDSGSYAAALSSDGNVIAFQSEATNLVNDDLNGLQDVFVHELDTLRTTRVSVAGDGSEANYPSHQPALSADGRYVAFLSLASNLVTSDENGKLDVFVHDRLTHVTRRVSVSADGSRGAGDTCRPSALLDCATPALSADGSIVVFESDAGDLVPGSVPGQRDVYWARWQELPAP